MDMDPDVVKNELSGTPYVIATRGELGPKPREDTLIQLFEGIESSHKRRLMMDKNNLVYIFYQDTPEGETDAEALSLNPTHHIKFGKGFSFDYRRS
jgi:hypothetical protein